MPIAYDPTLNTITVVGFSESSPCTFEDIYQASVDNGWGVVEKAGSKSYFINAYLQFGDGETETYFADKQFCLEMPKELITEDGERLVDAKDNAFLDFQQGIFLFSGSWGGGSWGRFNLGENSTVDWCFFMNPSGDVVISVGSIVDSYAHFQSVTPKVRIQGVRIKKTGLNVYSPVEISDVRLEGQYVGIRTSSSGPSSFENIKAYGNTYAIQYNNYVNQVKERYLINCYFDSWKVYIYYHAGTTGYPVIWRKYKINLRVIDSDGNPVTGLIVRVFDKDGNKVGEYMTTGDYFVVEMPYAKLDGGRYPEYIGSGNRYAFEEDEWEIMSPFKIQIWNGSELLYESVLKDEDYVNNPPAYIDITIDPPSFTLADLMEEIQSHRDQVEPKIDVPISSRLASDDSRLDNLDAKISSRSSHTPADVWSYPDRGLSNPDDYKADVSGLEDLVQAIKSQTDRLQFDGEGNLIATLTSSLVEVLSLILGLVQHNYRLTDVVYEEAGGRKKLKSAKVLLYASREDLENGGDPIAAYRLDLQYDEEGNLIDYRSVKL